MANLTGPMGGFPIDSTTREASASLPLGTLAWDHDGNEYRYVCAGADVAANDAVRFQGSAAGWDDVRPTSATGQNVIGVATAAFDQSVAPYGFVLTRGVVTCKVVVSTTALLPLVTTATAGTLDDAAETSLAGVRGIVALVTGVAAGSAVALL